MLKFTLLAHIIFLSVFCQGQKTDKIYKFNVDYNFSGRVSFYRTNNTTQQIDDLNSKIGGVRFNFSRSALNFKKHDVFAGIGMNLMGNNLKVNTSASPKYTYKIQLGSIIAPIAYQYSINKKIFINYTLEPGFNLLGGVSRKDLQNSESSYQPAVEVKLNRINLNMDVGLGIVLSTKQFKNQILINPKYNFFNNGISDSNLKYFSIGIGVTY